MVIVFGGIVEVLMLVVVVVVVMLVVVVVVVVTADWMVLAVATGVDMGTSFAMRMWQERKGTHPGRHQGHRQEEDRMETLSSHEPSLHPNPGGAAPQVFPDSTRRGYRTRTSSCWRASKRGRSSRIRPSLTSWRSRERLQWALRSAVIP